MDGLGEFQDLVGDVQQLLVLLLLLLDCLLLVVGQHLALLVARFWLIIAKVDRKMASSDTIMHGHPALRDAGRHAVPAFGDISERLTFVRVIFLP